MDRKQIRNLFAILLAMIVAFFGLFYFGGYRDDMQQFTQVALASDQLATETLFEGATVRQQFAVSGEELTTLAVRVASGDYAHFSYAISANDQVLFSGTVAQTTQGGSIELLPEAIPLNGVPTLLLQMIMLDGNNTGFFYGNMIALARGMVEISGLTEANSLTIDGKTLNGKLNLMANYKSVTNVSGIIWILLAGVLILWGLEYISVIRQYRKGRISLLMRVALAMKNYSFVLQQLISRDFKAKYKRSVLGVLWSFLNPLLTMVIQYIVFSTIFKSSIVNFPVYLLSGTICFSFFSEATSTGLLSISGNASLITKVYLPKYIFPISRVLSSGINFSFSLIPLLATILLSGLPITRAYLFLPYIFLCLGMLCIGLAMLLATIMVFFRDVQFLWSVFTTLLMYATPLFYPESIIPDQFKLIYKINPLYHVTRLFRTVLMDCAAPAPRAVVICGIICGAALALGMWVFKKNQDRFVLNL